MQIAVKFASDHKEMQPEEIINGFRLSPQQERLWLLQQETPAYRAQCAILLEGSLKTEVLKETIHRVIRRYEVLRTTFHSLPGMKTPVQVIADNSAPAWQVRDLSDRSPQDQAAEIEDLFRKDRSCPVDFGQGPLLRASLLTLSADKQVLFLSSPSMCADARTLQNLVHEISQSYDACLTDEDLREEPMQYVQFSEWQNELLEDEDAEAGKDFWRKQPAAAFPALKLPFENERAVGAASGSERGFFDPDSLALAIDRETAAKIAALAKKQDASTADFLQACWQTLLWRLAGESDIVIGQACDGRQHEVLHNTLGLFAKWLPIHCHFEENFRFTEVLSQIAASGRAAYERQEYFVWPDGVDGGDSSIFESPQRKLGDRSSPAYGTHPPFFPFGFEFEERPLPQRVNGLSFSVYKQNSCTERFNIKLSCHRMGDLLTAEFHYHPGRYAAEDVKRLAGHFETLLRSAVEDVEAPIGELEILNEADRRELLVAFNRTETDYPQDKCVHRLFEEQVKFTPDNPAVEFKDQQLSYAELNARANQLARHLRKQGVGPETMVALCLERSVEMVVGILGILKAGGAYVPLEPTYPKERLAFVLADTRSAVLLTQERVVEALGISEGEKERRREGETERQRESDNLSVSPSLRLSVSPSLIVVCLDSDWETIAEESEENLAGEATAGNLAYVIYTSGSTGRPKGVMIAHRSVVNLAAGLRQTVYAGQAAPLRVSLNAPVTFDASVKQLVQLLDGHTLCILPEEVRPEGHELLSYVSRHGLDVLDCTPAQLQLLLAAGFAQKPDSATNDNAAGCEPAVACYRPNDNAAGCEPAVACYRPKLALVGGEAMDDATWAFLAGNDLTSFYNVYGPTECTVDATVCRLQSMPEPAIGRPIANAKTYLLDERLRPVPIGVPGELHIGGAGLARGYLNRPDLAAERFIPNPFSEEPGARLYKTGDLARYLPDGSIKFLGRIDHQVKLRGYRIELGEIEAVLEQHPAVLDGVTIIREDVPGDSRLVAYVVLSREPGSVMSELRSFLREKLPEYMVPSAFVRLNEVPLTRHGKVDRQALPAPESERPELHAAYVAPKTRIEGTICAIWQEVLRVEKVGMEDNFFDLGGHSLLMVQVHSRLREAFSKDISLIEMFRSPTVGSLAKYFADEERTQPPLQKAHDRAEKRRRARSRQTPVRQTPVMMERRAR